MKKILTNIILSIFCFTVISQSFADIIIDNPSVFYQTELTKTIKGRYYKKVVDNIMERYGNDLEAIKTLKNNIYYTWSLRKDTLKNKDLSNMLNYLDATIDIILRNFALEENKQFMLVLEKAGIDINNVILPYFASIGDSKISPYQSAGMDMGWLDGGGGIVLFYRTNPNEEWQYFTMTQERISCDKYNTLDIRKAFFGDMCYDINSGKYKIIDDVDNPNNWSIFDMVTGEIYKD